ncbi:hypothetical protein GCM10007863_32650 [Dyella mobilis]|nr:hypothetical protein GCM10007863_32650 [Dyella mobilis]
MVAPGSWHVWGTKLANAMPRCMGPCMGSAGEADRISLDRPPSLVTWPKRQIDGQSRRTLAIALCNLANLIACIAKTFHAIIPSVRA